MAKHARTDRDAVFLEGRLVSEETRLVDVTADAVRFASHQTLRAARLGNRAHRGRGNAATPAQVRDQVAALTEQVHLLTALVLSLTGAPDVLDDDEILSP